MKRLFSSVSPDFYPFFFTWKKPEICYYNEAPFAYQDSLWCSSQSDTLHRHNSSFLWRTFKLTPTNWLGFMLFRTGL